MRRIVARVVNISNMVLIGSYPMLVGGFFDHLKNALQSFIHLSSLFFFFSFFFFPFPHSFHERRGLLTLVDIGFV